MGVLQRAGQEPMPENASSSPLGSSPDPQISIFAHLFPTRHKAPPGRTPGGLEVNVMVGHRTSPSRVPRPASAFRHQGVSPPRKERSDWHHYPHVPLGFTSPSPLALGQGLKAPTLLEIEHRAPGSFGGPAVWNAETTLADGFV